MRLINTKWPRCPQLGFEPLGRALRRRHDARISEMRNCRNQSASALGNIPKSERYGENA